MIPILWALVGCGVPTARFEALETSFDQAAAARDRALADVDACRAEASAAEREATAARQPEEAARAAFAGLPGAEGTAWRTLPDAWFAPGTADPKPPPVPLADVARRLAAVGGRVAVEVSVGSEAADTREYPTPWHLAADRAVAVARALVEAGLPAERVVATAVFGPPSVTVRWDAASQGGE